MKHTIPSIIGVILLVIAGAALSTKNDRTETERLPRERSSSLRLASELSRLREKAEKLLGIRQYGDIWEGHKAFQAAFEADPSQDPAKLVKALYKKYCNRNTILYDIRRDHDPYLQIYDPYDRESKKRRYYEGLLEMYLSVLQNHYPERLRLVAETGELH